MNIKVIISGLSLKSKSFIKFIALICFLIASNSYSQSAYSTPRNYGEPLNLTESAQYVGQLQHQMQLKYEKNQERLQDKFDDIYSAMISAKRKNNGLTQSQVDYYNAFITNYNKVLNSNLSDTVYVNDVLSYMRKIQEVVYSW